MTLSRRTLLAALAALPLGAAARRALADDEGVGEEAEITSIDLARRVLELRMGRPARVRRATFNDFTTVARGTPGLASVNDLRPGMRVRVVFARTSAGRERELLVRILL